MARVLVTGGTGFVGTHCLLRLLGTDYEVQTTVRNSKREADLRALLGRAGAEDVGRLTVFHADLNSDAGWAEAAAGCDFVIHIASPFPATVPKDPNELIVPARDGALRALKAARDAGVKRVVLTSSFAAIGYGHGNRTTPFTEEDWTNLEDPAVAPYQRSKTIAERAAWHFIEREGNSLELAVVNPVGIFGPVLGEDYASSILLVKRMMDGSMPGVPDLWFGGVDVREVVDLHILAMTNPAAVGQRFLATSGDFLNIREIARVLKSEVGGKIPSISLPNWLMRVVGLFDSQVRSVVPELGKQKNASSAKAQRLLGWTPIPPRDAIVATGRSLLEHGFIS